ncbi:SDR family oxidoreductase [Kordiimonas aestuarii]|uniref:SDR family oxidoreductase n=1 Tax=Kordiimonas aestuarii TaxID=1005925 RepID=UPI0021D1F919|nr:sugar nucleotide-binding protein [Kordiimonas aestuarii]
MKLAITGSSGLLGSTLTGMAEERGVPAHSLDRGALTAMGLVAAREQLRTLGADTLVHCAANTDVEWCEQNAQACMRDNVGLTEFLLNVCAPLGIKFVFISSTGIYGNYQDRPFTDHDAVHPTTVHHASKWQAEQVVMALNAAPLVVRTGWLFGGAASMKKNFVANRIREARGCGGTMQSDQSQWGNPTYTLDLAHHLLRFIEAGLVGTFNCVNAGPATRFDYVSRIVALAGEQVEVQPTPAAHFKRVAKVSHNEAAVCSKLEQFGLYDMPDWQESLAAYMKTLVKELDNE